MRIRKLIIVAILLVGGCRASDKNAQPASGGTIVIATTSEPDALFPPLALNMEARQATELIFEYLADVGVSMNTIGDAGFVKELASGWSWKSDSASIAFTIDPRAKWQDGPRVTSEDVKFSFSVYTNPVVGSAETSDLADIDSVTTPDSSTAVFWFRRRTPHQFYDAASQMLILPAHLLSSIPADSLRARTAGLSPVGSGRYRLARWERGARFELRAVDAHYRGRASPNRLIWIVTPEYQTAVAQLLAGAADVFPTVRRESITQLTRGGRFNLISLPGMDYVFMQFNLRDPVSHQRWHRLFASRGLRRAITMALDRTSMVRSLFDTLATVSLGPTVRAYPTTDTAVAQITFDRAAAERTLDSLGWLRPQGGGTRTKHGTLLSFDLLVPVSSLSRVRMAVLIQEQLRQVGIDMRIEQMDYSAFVDRQSKRTFDAALAGWHLGSRADAVRDTWTTAATQKDGLNYGSYSNPVFDALVDSAVSASSPVASKDYFRRANQIVVDDAPAVWLYEPRTVIAVDRRIRVTPMRPNAWWLDIASWKIPPEERIPRDQPSMAPRTR